MMIQVTQIQIKDIDTVHKRPDGTARKRFADNRKRFIEGVDYHKISPSEFRTTIGEMDIRQQNEITLITESGEPPTLQQFLFCIEKQTFCYKGVIFQNNTNRGDQPCQRQRTS